VRILIFHGYLLRGTGSNIYNANLARALAGLGHEVHLFCQDRMAVPPKGVTIHVPDIGRLLPVYVADHYEDFDALPFPEINDIQLSHYLDANIAAIRSVPSPDIALANHLVMGPAILARGLGGRAPYAVKIHGSALEYTVRVRVDSGHEAVATDVAVNRIGLHRFEAPRRSGVHMPCDEPAPLGADQLASPRPTWSWFSSVEEP